MQVDEIISRVEQICKKQQVSHLLLYGSYAKGTQTQTSDLDFAVIGCDNVRNVIEEVDLIPTLKKIDILDYDKCKNEFLKRDIEKHGKKIY